MPVHKPSPIQKKDIEIEAFHGDILKRELVSHPPDNTTDLIDLYNRTHFSILDFHAPAKTKTITIQHQSPWYIEEIRNAKKQRRNAERRWRLTVHLGIY